MSDDDIELELACVDRVSDHRDRPVNIEGRYLGVQQEVCVKEYGHGCEYIVRVNAINLAPRIFAFNDPEHANDMFSFTDSKLALSSCTLLYTNFGRLRCLPDTEYHIWRAAGLCHVAPLVILLDAVKWRVIASENAIIETDDVISLADDIDPVFKTFIHAHKNGGAVLEEVKTAIALGEKDLKEHRTILFKLSSIVGIPPTLSHDLTKTTLVNFCLGRSFYEEHLDQLNKLITRDQCMYLVKKLHLEVENHHPEHGPRPILDIRDMYLDRVSRGIQKEHGWDNKAWSINERYVPAEFKKDFARFEKQYSTFKLSDPGDVHVHEKIPGALINLVWEDFYP